MNMKKNFIIFLSPLIILMSTTFTVAAAPIHDQINKDRFNTYLQTSQKNELFFEALRTELQRSVSNNGGHIGISFYCLTTGGHISINGDQLFFGASTSKFPTSLMIADMIEEGVLSWDQQVSYQPHYYEGGTGVLQQRVRVGDSYPIDQLMKLTLVESDNIAHRMLSSLFTSTHETRVKYIFNRYLPSEQTDGTNHFTPNQMTKMLATLYNGKEENSSYAKIYEHMSSSIYHSFLNTPATRNHIAHKIGLNGAYYNDIGIFSARYPYILVVMTYQVPDPIGYIGRVSDLVWSLNDRLR